MDDPIGRIDLRGDTIAIAILLAALAGDAGGETPFEPIRIEAPLGIRQAGQAKPIVIELDRCATKPDADLVAMVADARRSIRELATGAVAQVAEIERRKGEREGTVSRILPLAFLAPDIVESSRLCVEIVKRAHALRQFPPRGGTAISLARRGLRQGPRGRLHRHSRRHGGCRREREWQAHGSGRTRWPFRGRGVLDRVSPLPR